MKYRIVSAKGKSGLEANVNELLTDGWQLAGGVATDDGWFYQAMTKPDELHWITMGESQCRETRISCP